MIGYFLYFQFVKSDEFINSPYNSLQDLFSKNVVRGEIQTKDGHVIARTKVSSDASETREYPDGRLFAHVAGFAVNGKAGLEKQENFSLLRSHEFFLDQIVNDISGKKNTGDNVITTLDYEAQALHTMHLTTMKVLSLQLSLRQERLQLWCQSLIMTQIPSQVTGRT